jgi:hypothetical protein
MPFTYERDGGVTPVNTTVAGQQTHSAVTGLADGGYVTTWMSGSDIYAQRYDASGRAQGGETLVNTTTASDQLYP